LRLVIPAARAGAAVEAADAAVLDMAVVATEHDHCFGGGAEILDPQRQVRTFLVLADAWGRGQDSIVLRGVIAEDFGERKTASPTVTVVPSSPDSSSRRLALSASVDSQ